MYDVFQQYVDNKIILTADQKERIRSLAVIKNCVKNNTYFKRGMSGNMMLSLNNDH
jgi:hypothetical protein